MTVKDLKEFLDKMDPEYKIVSFDYRGCEKEVEVIVINQKSKMIRFGIAT